MDKSLGTLLHFWAFPIHTGPNPPLTPQTMLDACIHNFLRVSTLYMVGEGKLQENLEKYALFYDGPRMTEKYEYCITVPRTFVHECRLTLFSSRLLLFSPRTKH